MKKLFSFLSLSLVLTSLASAKVWKASDDLETIYNREIQGKSAKAIQDMSIRQYAKFIEMDVNSYENNVHYNVDSKKALYLTKVKADRTLKAADTNPVVGLHQYDKYDPFDQGIGFCFGRAMFVDLYLTINGLNRGSIKKAFVVGPMDGGDGMKWGWHVSTIVQSQDKNKKEIWLAVDPIMGRVMSVVEWYRENLKSSEDGKLRLYIADAGKFGKSPSSYDEQAITDTFYNKYFTDMMSWFAKNDISSELKLQ